MGTRKRPGRPPKSSGKLREETLVVRVEPGEKQSFKAAADLAGIGVSAWTRERLRCIARQELEEAGLPIAFLNHVQED